MNTKGAIANRPISRYVSFEEVPFFFLCLGTTFVTRVEMRALALAGRGAATAGAPNAGATAPNKIAAATTVTASPRVHRRIMEALPVLGHQ